MWLRRLPQRSHGHFRKLRLQTAGLSHVRAQCIDVNWLLLSGWQPTQRLIGLRFPILSLSGLGRVDIQRSQIIAAARQSIEKKLHAVFSKRVAMRR